MSLTRKLLQIAGFAAVALSVTAIADSIQERIAPVGSVCMAGDECAASAAPSADTGPRSGQQIVEASCNACHASGAAGAPVVGNAGDWEPRIAKGIETLYDNAWNGFNGMPAKGLCMDCTREEMNAAVDYMVENSQ